MNFKWVRVKFKNQTKTKTWKNWNKIWINSTWLFFLLGKFSFLGWPSLISVWLHHMPAVRWWVKWGKGWLQMASSLSLKVSWGGVSLSVKPARPNWADSQCRKVVTPNMQAFFSLCLHLSPLPMLHWLLHCRSLSQPSLKDWKTDFIFFNEMSESLWSVLQSTIPENEEWTILAMYQIQNQSYRER